MASMNSPISLSKEVTLRTICRQRSVWRSCAATRVFSLAVVEGSYSLHPELAPMYDITVCLTLSPELQRRRILARNGEEMARRFFERWIPLEQAYFDAMKPQTRCGFLIEADQLSDEAPL